MVNTYKRKTGSQSLYEDKMKNAITQVFNNEMNLNTAATACNDIKTKTQYL